MGQRFPSPRPCGDCERLSTRHTMLYLARHGPTSWNEAGRIQGRTDIALSRTGRTSVLRRQVHASWLALNWHCSPLRRAIETATALGVESPHIEPLLTETNWGEFEGLTLQEIGREIDQRGMQPASGLDFQPPGGESPREVAHRLKQWLEQLEPGPHAGLTHKGVIRAALHLATGWDMQATYPDTIDWHLPLRFQLSPDHTLQLDAINLPWEQPSD